MKPLCSLWGSISMALMFISFVTYGIFPASPYIVIAVAAIGFVYSFVSLKKDKESAKDDRNAYYIGIAFNAMAVIWTALSPFIRDLLFTKNAG